MTNVHEKSGLLVQDGNIATTRTPDDDIIVIINNNNKSSRIALAGFVFAFVVISMIGHLMPSSLSSSSLSSSPSSSLLSVSNSYSENGNLESREVIGSSNGLVSLSIVNDKDFMDIGAAKPPTQPVCKGKTSTNDLRVMTCPHTSDEDKYYGKLSSFLCDQRKCEHRGGTYDSSDMECFGSPPNRFCRTNLKCCDIPLIPPTPRNPDDYNWGKKIYCAKCYDDEGDSTAYWHANYDACECCVCGIGGYCDYDDNPCCNSSDIILKSDDDDDDDDDDWIDDDDDYDSFAYNCYTDPKHCVHTTGRADCSRIYNYCGWHGSF